MTRGCLAYPALAAPSSACAGGWRAPRRLACWPAHVPPSPQPHPLLQHHLTPPSGDVESALAVGLPTSEKTLTWRRCRS